MSEYLAYRDPAHPGNKIRPQVSCIGCGIRGCITAWGPWCFKCNIERMDRISAQMDKLRKALDADKAERAEGSGETV